VSVPLLLLALGGAVAAGDSTAATSPGAATTSVEPIPADLQAAMTGVSWHEGCPVPLSDLRLVTVPYVDDTGAERHGQLVLHRDQADAVATVFAGLFTQRFVIHRIELASQHGGSDDALMEGNITSAFNCRPVTGGRGWSEHSSGAALDLNPLWNPYVKGDRVLPDAGRTFVDRDATRPGTTIAGGPAVSAFSAIGWRWGGSWRSLKDYQHFSASGR